MASIPPLFMIPHLSTAPIVTPAIRYAQFIIHKIMKNIVFVLLMAICAIPFAQPPVDSCGCPGIHYTDTQDANCLECIMNRAKLLQKIDILEIQKKEFQQYTDDQQIEIDKLRTENDILFIQNVKLDQSKRTWRTIAFSFLGIISIETAIILIK